MKIRLNGDSHQVAAPLTVSALLAELGIDPRRVAVEHNQIVVKRTAYDDTLISEGDEVEIVNFVGGGSGRHFTASTVAAARGVQRAVTRRLDGQESLRMSQVLIRQDVRPAERGKANSMASEAASTVHASGSEAPPR